MSKDTATTEARASLEDRFAALEARQVASERQLGVVTHGLILLDQAIDISIHNPGAATPILKESLATIRSLPSAVAYEAQVQATREAEACLAASRSGLNPPSIGNVTDQVTKSVAEVYGEGPEILAAIGRGIARAIELESPRGVSRAG